VYGHSARYCWKETGKGKGKSWQSWGNKGKEKGNVKEVSEEEDHEELRDIGGIWEISTGRKSGRSKVASGNRAREDRQAKHRNRWREVAPQEESDDDDAGRIGLVGMRPEETGWEALHITVDSGAVDTVGPQGMASKFPLQPTEASKRGMHYRAANDTKSPYMGKQRTSAGTPMKGLRLDLKFGSRT
jgi:hypothetical protein